METESNPFRIAVLIPCYNEENTLAAVVRNFREALPEAVIYVYDNNSTDRTVEEATAAGAIVHCEYDQGKGNVQIQFRTVLKRGCLQIEYGRNQAFDSKIS